MADKYAAATEFFANQSEVVITDPTTADTYTVGVLQDCQINVTWEFVPLYGMDSIIMRNVAKHSQKVEVKVKFASFDPTLANDFFGAILNPTTPAAGTVEDTNKVKTFTIKATVHSFDTTPIDYAAEVTGCYFENLPALQMTQNEWVARDLTITGMNITLTNPVA